MSTRGVVFWMTARVLVILIPNIGARYAPSYTPFAFYHGGWLSRGPSEKSKNCIRKNCFVCDHEKQVTQSKYFLSGHILIFPWRVIEKSSVKHLQYDSSNTLDPKEWYWSVFQEVREIPVEFWKLFPSWATCRSCSKLSFLLFDPNRTRP